MSDDAKQIKTKTQVTMSLSVLICIFYHFLQPQVWQIQLSQQQWSSLQNDAKRALQNAA